MNPTIYKQLDSRWASKPYPTYASSFGGNGCGCCACVHVAMEQESKANWNPESLRPWMVDQGFAYVNQGTTWQGITATLKYIGHKEVVCVWNDPMSSAWAELDKGNRIGVLLVDNSSTPDGTYWTSSGHYVAFTDYKKDANGHWFYIKDSGGRNHDGWFCYEKSIRGALPKLWIVERIGKAPTPTPPKKHTDVLDISEFQPSIDFAKVKASGIDGVMVRCGFRGYESAKLMEDAKYMEYIKGASKAGLKCGVYFFTEAINEAEGREEARYAIDLIKKSGVSLYYPVAVDTEAIGPSARADKISVSARTDAIYGFCDEIKKHGGVPMIYASTSWFSTHLDMSRLPYKIWCAQYYKECQYKGEVSMWQYTSEGSVNGVKGVVDMNECYITSASPQPKPTPSPTPTGEHYPGEYPNPKRYLEYGDKGTEVGKLQDYINWFTDGVFYKKCGGRDNTYGRNTLDYCKQMQEKLGFPKSECNGEVGPKTIAKMKAYTKPVKPTPSGKYTGPLPTESDIRAAARGGIKSGIASWCKQIAEGGQYGYKTFTDDRATQICPICNSQPKKYWGWNCIGFAFASWKHGGGIPCTCNCGVIYNSLGDNYYYMSNIEVLKSLQNRIGTNDIQLIRNDNDPIPQSSLQEGDLLMFYRNKTYVHMGVYVGGGKVSDSANPSDGIRYGTPYANFSPCLIAIRYTGARSYMKLGDKGLAVSELQDYLNWYTDGKFFKECGPADGTFGPNTDRYTKAMQTDFFGAGDADGLVGMRTVNKMKAVRK